MATYEQHARADWLNAEKPREYPGNEKMVIGCLQRIATALEAIRDRLDPVCRKAERKRAAGQAVDDAEDEKRQRLWQLWNPVEEVIEARVRAELRRLAARIPLKQRQGIRELYWQVCGSLQSQHLYDGESTFPDREPTADDAGRAKRAADSFDPLTFDWDSVRMGPVKRERLREAIRLASEANGQTRPAGAPAEGGGRG